MVLFGLNFNLAFASVDQLSYTGDSFNIGSYGLGVSFSEDGTKMYRQESFGSNTIHQYDLSTPWDITTAESDGTGSLTSNGITGLYFKDDGTKLYALHFYTRLVYQYTLSTPWDISTVSSDSVFKNMGFANHYTFTMSRDGSAIYAVDSTDYEVNQFNLSTAWDLSTASGSADATLSVPSSLGGYRNGATFSGDGSILYILTTTTSTTEARILQYDLSTPWDVSTATKNDSEFDLTDQSDGMRGLFVDADDQYLFTRGESSGKYDIFKYQFSAPDQDAPVITSVDASISTSTATITWTTDEEADSTVHFGPDTNRDSSSNDATLETSHSVLLSDLQPCSQYSYQVTSADASDNTATSSASSFYTAGCVGDTTINNSTQASIGTVAGGELSLDSLALDISGHFIDASSTDSIIFQINKIGHSDFYSEAGTPADKIKAGNNVFNLKSFFTATTSITNFFQPITVTISYTDDEINGLDEDSLLIHRYDGSEWHQLDDCSVNKTDQEVSCTTTNFSDFAIFGDAVEVNSASSSSTTSGGVRYGCKDENALNYDYFTSHRQSLCEYEEESAGIRTTFINDSAVGTHTDTNLATGSTNYVFSKNLRPRMTDSDVLELQKYLNDTGFVLSISGAGSPGNETTYFGPRTQNALIEFQNYYAQEILEPIGLVAGTGFFAEMTRAFINAD